MSEQSILIPSASVILLRAGDDGIEVLLLKKNEKITFGGSWVFPGGRVDPDDTTTDSDPYITEKNTAIRECHEEVGLTLQSENLWPISRWTTPDIRPKRFTTVFFIHYSENSAENGALLRQSVQIDHFHG